MEIQRKYDHCFGKLLFIVDLLSTKTDFSIAMSGYQSVNKPFNGNIVDYEPPTWDIVESTRW
jgi:hypothetical protein